MRTTVILDPDVARKVRQVADRTEASFKQTINQLLRRGLLAREGGLREGSRFTVVPHAGGLRPGIDPAKLNQHLDQMEADDIASEARLGR